MNTESIVGPRKRPEPSAPSLLLFLPLILLSTLPSAALEVQASFPSGGREALLCLQHSPAKEPLGALRIRIRFKEQVQPGVLTVWRTAEGPWSQVQPELRMDGRTAEIFALAPTIGESRDEAPVTIANLRLALEAPIKAPVQAEDLVDSVSIEEAVLPWGGRGALTHRLTTSVEALRATPPEGPRERIHGLSRTLSFTLAKAGRVQVRVLDASGRTAVKVFDGRLSSGLQEITWDGKGSGGNALPKGTWFLRLQAGTFTYNRKLEVAP